MTLTNIHPTMRLLVSGAVILAVLAAVAGVSSALFSDTATLENSTFATGNVDLLIAQEGNSPVAYLNSIQGPVVENMLPGQTSEFEFWLKNNSSAESEVSLDLSVLIENIQTLPANSTDIKEDLSVGFSCDVGDDGETLGDGSVDAKPLSDWENDGGIPTGGLGTLGPNDGTVDGEGSDEARCTMTATLDINSEATNKSVNFDAEFTGTQSTPEATPEPTPLP
ncbi:MAG: TasA family protein [Candidatus Andersenbacteria bacterium]